MVHIGVLIVPPIQLLDIAPIDLFAMTSEEYFKACNLPKPLVDIAIPDADFKITYIAHTGPESKSPTTAHLRLSIDAGLDDDQVKPGKLDILMIPGPPPAMKPPEEVLQFVRDHVVAGVELLAICTGVFVAGYSGVLDGKRASGPRGVLNLLKKECPKVQWAEQRYVQEGKIWTSGGITNGMDMVAAYLKYRWPGALSETVLGMAEVQPRPLNYDQSKVGFITWFLSVLFKAWFQRLTKRSKAE